MNKNNKPHKEPLLNIEEPAPIMLACILALAHLAYTLAPADYQSFLRSAGVLAADQGNVFFEGRPLGNISTLLTHTLLHAGWGHVLINASLMTAFGVITIRGTKNRRLPIWGRIQRGSAVFWAIFVLGALGGGLLQWGVWTVSGATGAAIGASSGGAALFASAAWALGGKQRLLIFGLILVGYDALILFSSGFTSGLHNPAWAAHLGGYLAGAVLSPLFVKPASVGLGRD